MKKLFCIIAAAAFVFCAGDASAKGKSAKHKAEARQEAPAEAAPAVDDGDQEDDDGPADPEIAGLKEETSGAEDAPADGDAKGGDADDDTGADDGKTAETAAPTPAEKTPAKKAVAEKKPDLKKLSRAQQVLYYVNLERKKRGKKPLKLSDRCQRKAEARAKAICRRFNHKGAFGGLGCYKWKAENIAKGQRSPRAVVRAWMRSKGHRKNMMSGKYDYMGVGYCRGRWVQTFGGGKTRVWGKNKPKKIIHRRPKKKKVKIRR